MPACSIVLRPTLDSRMTATKLAATDYKLRNTGIILANDGIALCAIYNP